jgi:hypothetical protein
MVGPLLVAVASVLTVAAIEVIAESARSGARDIVMFGHQLASPGSPAGAWVLIGLVVLAVVAWSAAFAWFRGHRLERRMGRELGVPHGTSGPRSTSDVRTHDELAARRAGRSSGTVT